jgi:hypothetical protein
MQRAITAGGLNCERVEIPYQGSGFPGLFVKGHGEGPRPCMVFCNGLDSVKEMTYLSGGQRRGRGAAVESTSLFRAVPTRT